MALPAADAWRRGIPSSCADERHSEENQDVKMNQSLREESVLKM